MCSIKKYFVISFSSVFVSIVCEGRMWTLKDGRNIEAKIVNVYANQTVKLKSSKGRVVRVPFNAFSSEDITALNTELLISQGKLDRVPYSEMNELLKWDVWSDHCLWDDRTAEVAARVNLSLESKTDFIENYRAYPLGEESVLGEPVYAVALYGDEKNTTSMSLIFLNIGDIELPSEDDVVSPRQLEQVGRRIDQTANRIKERISELLGDPRRDLIGNRKLKERVFRWDWNDHAIMLSIQDQTYVALRIMPIARADRGGRVEKLTENELKARMASCVEQRKNGDLFIKNIPMIDQGPKGFCAPATWERYLRYMEIPADMYLLALGANTGTGGTYSDEMFDAIGNLISSNGRELVVEHSSLSIDELYEYLSQGIPLGWSFLSNGDFQREVNKNTARRNRKKLKKDSRGPGEGPGSGGHICLIVGCNKKTDEICISDSWGPECSERWVPVSEARAVSSGRIYAIKW